MENLLKSLREYWVILVGCSLLFISVGESRYQISQLWVERARDTQQDERMSRLSESIGQLKSSISVLQQKHIEIDRVITPESMQKWGQVQADVIRLSRNVDRLNQHLSQGNRND